MNEAVDDWETNNTPPECPLLSWSPSRKITAEIHAHLDAARVNAPLGAVFGVPLALQDSIPRILVESIGFLDTHGLYQSGLFRVPGNNESIADLKVSYVFPLSSSVQYSLPSLNISSILYAK